MSFNLAPYTGSNPIFREEEETYNFNQSINKVNFRQVPPSTTQNIAPSNQAAFPTFPIYQKISFDFTTERFTALRDWSFFFRCDVNAQNTTPLTPPLLNLPSLVQAPYCFAQLISSFDFWIEGQKICNTKETDFSILSSFLFTPMKHEKNILDRVGKPFSKIIQERNYAQGPLVSSYDEENDGTGILRIINQDNPAPEQNQIIVPMYLFSNFFAKPNLYLPPGLKIKIEIELTKAQMFSFYDNFCPGNVYGANVAGIVSYNFVPNSINNFCIYLKEFHTTDLFANQFISRWKQNLWMNRYLDIENSGFYPIRLDGTTKDFQRIRISISEPSNTFLMFFVANGYRAPTGYEAYTLQNITNTRTFQYAQFAPTQTSTLLPVPFKMNYLRVYLEGGNQPIIDFTTFQTPAPETILRSLNELTKNFCKTLENEESINKSDIYGLRAAPLMIPLSFDKLNSNAGPLPVFGNYLIDFNISSIDLDTPLLAGFYVYLKVVRSKTVGISITKELSIVKTPIEIEKSQQKLIGTTAAILS